jgi:hypothetical protein
VATARLPGLDIEIIHRRSLNDEAEQISIHLQGRGMAYVHYKPQPVKSALSGA